MSEPSGLSPLAFNASYNPAESLLHFTSIYGNDTVVTFGALQSAVNKSITEAIVFGTRCGASILTLIIMWMISRNRKTPVFIINQVSLTLIIIHSGLYFKYLLSGYGSITYGLSEFPQLISSNDIHSYAAANIIQVLLVASIESSLIFQIKVIFTGDTLKKVGVALTALATALGLSTVAMYFVTAITSIISIYSGTGKTSPTYYNVSIILLASSINFMTLILVVKLILAIRSRRFLGLKQFDSFHILLIISCQTLLAPSILFILAYSLNEDDGTDVLIAIAVLLAVLSLPLSSMWATAANNTSKPSCVQSDFSPSSDSSYAKGSSSFYSESLYSGAKRNVRNNFYDLYPRSKPENDKQSDGMCYDIGDVEKNVSHELSTPITQGNINQETDVRSKITKRDQLCNIYTPHSSDDEDARKFWSGEVPLSSCDSTPIKRTSTENSDDLPSHL